MDKKSIAGNVETLLKANGVGIGQLRNIDKFHAGFLDCVVDIARNPGVDVSMQSKKVTFCRSGKNFKCMNTQISHRFGQSNMIIPGSFSTFLVFVHLDNFN